MDLKNAGILGGITDKYLCRGSLKSKVQQNTPDLSVSGPDKNILKIYLKQIDQGNISDYARLFFLSILCLLQAMEL